VNLDVSVAPELAQLISPPAAAVTVTAPPAAPAGAPGRQGAPTTTIGRLAQELRLITAAPERWWGLVRFDPEHPVRIEIPTGPAGAVAPSCEVWLMIIPPSPCAARAAGPAPTADGADGECRCEIVTVVAGELAEQVIGADGLATTPLPPGRIRVHGRGRLHRVMNRSSGYTVSLHARGGPADGGIIR